MNQLILDSTPWPSGSHWGTKLRLVVTANWMKPWKATWYSCRCMAEDYLHAFSSRSCAHIGCLRDVGDHCLLFSGLFPQLAERRLVSIGYFINRGLSAYM